MTAALALAVVVDVSVALAAGLLLCRVLRGRPAALRHLVLAASVCIGAAAPLLEVTLPRLELAVLTATAHGTTEATAFGSGPAAGAVEAVVAVQDAPGFAWMPMLVAIWAAGCGVLLGSLLAGLGRLSWLTRRCAPVEAGVWRERAAALSAQCRLRRPVTILESPDRALLVTWGLMRPRIIVPASAASWSEERIDLVLAHELAHIQRCDWAIQITAEALRAVHWFNPFVWVACRRLREESEYACDDVVLRRGVDAADYASHLLAVARHVLTAGGSWSSAPAVAHASTLERRITAMLNTSSNRRPITWTSRALAMLVTVAMTVPVAATTFTERVVESPFVRGAGEDVALAAVAAETPVANPAPARAAAVESAAATPVAVDPAEAPVELPVIATPVEPAQQKPAAVSGTVRDAQGGVMPGVLVVLSNNAAAASRESATTDTNGQFRFRNVAPGEYQFTASLPGFTTRTIALSVAEGQELLHNLTLAVGQLMETVVVTCAPASAALRDEGMPVLSVARRSTVPRLFPSVREMEVAPAFAAQGLPVRVGGQIKAPQPLKKTGPICPAVTPGAGLIVILEATIGTDGLIKDVKVLRPAPADDKQTGYVQAAVNAVRQWEFTPTLLNNVPTAVIMTATVSFVVPAK